MRRKRDSLAAAAIGTDGIISILPPDHVAYVPDCCFDLGTEKSNAELACGSSGNRERFGLLFKGTFAEPKAAKSSEGLEMNSDVRIWAD
jgi:hypothetical protein